jgi:DNA-binding NtrC family response regulator
MPDTNKNKDRRNTEPWPEAGSCIRFTILVWENDRLLRDVLRRTLESFGHVVLQAETAKEAFDLLRLWQGPIHMFLSEIPEGLMDQRVVFGSFCEKHPLASVVYMSSHNDQLMVGSSNRRKWFVVKKPFRPKELARFVGEVVTGKGSVHRSYTN